MARTNLNMTKGDCDQNPSQSIELETMDSPRSDHSDYSESSSIDIIDDGINRPGYCRRPWKYQSSNVEQKGLGYNNGDHKHRGCSSFCFYFSAIFAGVVLPLLVIWAISRQKPDLFLESITFDRYSIEESMDHNGFNTSMVTTNSSLKLTFTNTATFSGVQVTSIPLEIKNYNELPIATGNIPKFYQPRKSARSIDVMIEGSQIPLIAPDDNVLGESILLTLNLIVNSKANVIWILVTHKFNMNIECSFYMDPKKMSVPISLTNTCKTLD